jgi:hypothetical protein
MDEISNPLIVTSEPGSRPKNVTLLVGYLRDNLINFGLIFNLQFTDIPITDRILVR